MRIAGLFVVLVGSIATACSSASTDAPPGTSSGAPDGGASDSGSGGPGADGGDSDSGGGLKLAYHETFDAPFDDTATWVEDTYAKGGAYEADPNFGDDGAYFHDKGGATFANGLATFRSYRRSTTYGKDGWLTVEMYGRDSNKDGTPETGGKFVAQNGKAHLVSTRHYDGAILRSTKALPARYRIEVTVSNIAFDARTSADKADPWRFTDGNPNPVTVDENGVYFLCITDYPNPAPHNNVFIHHHRKVVMDTDDNLPLWSSIWNPTKNAAETSSKYVSMIWLDGRDWGNDWTGNTFTSWTPGGFKEGPIFADGYLPGESYTFTIEREADGYTMTSSGRFRFGGVTTYRGHRSFKEAPVTWHYNQTAGEYDGAFDQTKTFGGKATSTWPAGSAYPDFFFFGDPHINYYAGTADFDDVKLYLPE